MKMKRTVRMPLRRAPQRTRPPASSLKARAATAEESYDEEEDYGSEEEPNMKLSHAFMVVLVLHVIAVIGVFAFNSIKAGQTAAAKKPSKPAAAESTAAAAPAAKAPDAAPSKPAVIDGWKGRTHTVQAGDTLTAIATANKTTIEAIEKENGITTYSMIRVGQVLKIPAPAVAKSETPAPKPAADPSAATKQAFIAAKTDAAKPADDVIPAEPAKAAAPQPVALKSVPAPVPAAPQAPAKVSAKAPAPAPAASDAADSGIYVVAKGDNPYNIAKKLNVSYNELIAVNEIKDPTKIQIGQKLKVPAKKN